MKNLENITTVFSVMKGLNVSLDDLNAFSKNQNQESLKKLPLEILYENDYRSFFFEVDKKPVAIICDNIGVAFEDAPKEMNWKGANRYCKIYSVGGKTWQLPNKETGHIDTLYKNKESINVILKTLGKEPLKNGWYWASEHANGFAWGIRFSDGGVDWGDKYNGNLSVRPVLLF